MKRFELRLALREFFYFKRLILLLVINLTLGLVSFLTLSSFQTSLKNTLTERAKGFLAADIAVSARRKFTDAEFNALTKGVSQKIKVTRFQSLFAMAQSPSESRLIDVRGIEQDYPLYGTLTLEKTGAIESSSLKSIFSKILEPQIWVYPEVLIQFNVKIGDRLKIGEISFLISDVITEDSTQAFNVAGFAPKIYISIENLKAAGLVQFGTTMTDRLLYAFPAGTDLPEAKKVLLQVVQDSGVSVQTYIEAGDDTRRVLGYVFQYLALGSLVGLALGGFGLLTLIISWIEQKKMTYARYSILGLGQNKITQIFLLQLLAVGVLTSVLSFLATRWSLPYVMNLAQEYFAIKISAQVGVETLIRAFSLILGGIVLLIFPLLRKLKLVNTSQIFSGEQNSATAFSLKDSVLFLPAVFAFWLICFFEVRSVKLASGFVAMVLLTFILLGLLATPLFSWAQRSRRWFGAWWFKHGLLYLERNRSLRVIFVSLALGSCLSTLVPLIRGGIEEEMAFRSELDRPSLFLFDIQDEQLAPLTESIKAQGFELRNASPLVRAKIIKINEQAFERLILEGQTLTQEKEEEARMRNRGVNLSFREDLGNSSKIERGAPMGDWLDDEPIPLSIETWYAGTLNLKIGDRMTFDIQGVEVVGKVTNFRKVKWNSFQPNFFILMHPKALKDAPKTWVADVAQLNFEQRSALQKNLAKDFPNVSCIDIVRLIERLMDMMKKMMVALQSMAWLTWASGLFVMIAVMIRQLEIQRTDAVLMALLGGRSSQLRKVFLVQFFLLVLLAAVVGVVAAVALSFAIAQFLFEGAYSLRAGPILNSVFFSTIGGIALCLFYAHRLSRSSAAEILKGP